MPSTRLKMMCLVYGTFLSVIACSRPKKIHSPTPSEKLANLDVACRPSQSSTCDAIRQRIDDLSNARDEALAHNDFSEFATLTLDLNREDERLRLFLANKASAENLAKVDSKYAVMRSMLDQALHQREVTGSRPGTPFTSPNFPPSVYNPRESQVVSQVMTDLGDLYIKSSGVNPDGTVLWEEIKVDRPWAGYWYPLKGRTLFGDENSPLAKLDKVAANRSLPINAAALESVQANLAQEGWEGRCAAWAMASVMSQEPKGQRDVGGVTFSVQDQKALLTKIYELYPHRTYGIRYDGDAATDGTIQDIRPEALHRIFMYQLGERKQPFIIDDASGIEIWSKPVYRMRWTVQPDPAVPNAFRVIAQPWLIKHRNDEVEAPTSDADRASPEWNYRLYFDPDDRKEGAFRVVAGEWLGPSLNQHPDTATIPLPGGEPKSGNLEINKAMLLVKEILGIPL